MNTSYILLTGLSDGASQCYYTGLRYPNLFRAIAPVSGAFCPLAYLHIHQSPGTAVYIYHSVKDSEFPVSNARWAAKLMQQSKHKVTYFEDKGGGHEYPVEQTTKIAEWFENLDWSK